MTRMPEGWNLPNRRAATLKSSEKGRIEEADLE
jgi:hypothetical protein